MLGSVHEKEPEPHYVQPSSSASSGSDTGVREGDYSPIWRQTLKNLAAPGVRRLLNRVKQLVAIDSHIEVWADGLSFANAFSHPPVQLRYVERKPCRDGGWDPAIALRYREICERFASLRCSHSEL